MDSTHSLNYFFMDGYSLSRRWFDWCFRFPGHHTPAHAALYSWYVEANNRVSWAETFEMAPQYAMTAIGVRSYNTYKDTLADLQAWGFVRIRQKGANQYTPWLLALSKFDEPLDNPLDKALDKANGNALSNFDIPLNKAYDKASKDASSNFDKPLDKASDEPLDKALDNPRDAYTINNKPTNLKPKTSNKNTSDADAPVLENDSDKPKKPKKIKAPTPDSAEPPPPKIVTRIRDYLKSKTPAYNWDGKEAKAAKEITNKLRIAIVDHKPELADAPDLEDKVLNAFAVMVERTAELPAYYQFSDLPNLNSKFNAIITKLQSASKPGNTNKNGRSVAPAHRTREERVSDITTMFNELDSVFSS